MDEWQKRRRGNGRWQERHQGAAHLIGTVTKTEDPMEAKTCGKRVKRVKKIKRV